MKLQLKATHVIMAHYLLTLQPLRPNINNI